LHALKLAKPGARKPFGGSGIGRLPHYKSLARAVLAIDMIGEFNPQRLLGAPDHPA